jgi:stearoyl-CoA desaturase (delta-9 desaturase)
MPHAAVIAIPCLWGGFRIGAGWLALWAVMWLVVGGLGVSVGYHRHFAHRSFKANTFARALMAACGCMAAQGPPTYWVAIHRSHHGFSDRDGDPHSAAASRQRGRSAVAAFLHAHVTWAWRHDVPAPHRYARELCGDAIARAAARWYWPIVPAGIALPGLAAYGVAGTPEAFLLGAYWGGLFRIVVGHHVIWAINSVCHATGTRHFETRDHSRNVWWLAAISFGESWHNNHHARPASARFAIHAWQLDIGALIIAAMRRLGCAWDVGDQA